MRHGAPAAAHTCLRRLDENHGFEALGPSAAAQVGTPVEPVLSDSRSRRFSPCRST
eukprot:SAG11_NODE_5097_length_1665_cov_1.703065_1_plen_56_part_00